jgi:ribose transport system ATP-binding protein
MSAEPAFPVPLVRFAEVVKRFGGTLALDRVSLDLHGGEILSTAPPPTSARRAPRWPPRSA